MTDDFDRAAILARRRRAIALALGGLALGVGCKAQPCLSVAPTLDEEAQGQEDNGEDEAYDEVAGPDEADEPDDGEAEEAEEP